MMSSLPFLAWPPSGSALLSVLIFHRVLPEADPFRPGEIDAATFDRFMGLVARNFDVLPLGEAVRRLRNRDLRRRTCCITFDDGYSDNLTVALPILESRNLPATVFVATGFLDGGRMFNDSVIELVARTKLPELDLTRLGLPVVPVRSVVEKTSAASAILEAVKYYEPRRREDAIRSMIEIAECGSLPDDLMLTSSQVVELARRGVEIGGHTRTHTILNTLDDKHAMKEIARGRADLEQLLGSPVRSFAYPNGRPGRDFSERHAEMLRNLGFDAAVTTAHGVAVPESDPLQIPRFTPWGRSPFMLASRLVRNAWSA